MLSLRKKNALILYLLQALIQTTDLRIFQELTKGNEDDTFLKG